MEPAQLQQIEAMCDQLYLSADAAQRDEAQRSLLALQSSTDYIPQCQYILDNSSKPYALMIASQSLTHLVKTHWNNFTTAQRIDIRNYVLGYLATRGPTLATFVVASLIKFVCMITKLGWFDSQEHREFTKEITKFLQATVDHCIIGLRILVELVSQMNSPMPGETVATHRKGAVSFRDASLFHVFQIALTTLRQLRMGSVAAPPDTQQRIQEQALRLGQACLSFDFVGTNPDASSEEAGTVQVPVSWRPVVQEASTMTLLVDLYKSSEPPLSGQALELLLLFSSVRRSIFSSDSERRRFLGQLLVSLRDILRERAGLAVEENYHTFCRLLGRLKSNYQLSEMVRTEAYAEWIRLTAEFTVTSFGQWQWSQNSTHYLLALWSRLVAAIPYFKPDPASTGAGGGATGAPGAGKQSSMLDVYVPMVFQAYVEARLASVSDVLASDGGLDDPLQEEALLTEQLDKLPSICRYQYTKIGEYLVSLFDPLLADYTSTLQRYPAPAGGGAAAVLPAEVARAVVLLEGRLAWLVYITGSVVGGHSSMSSHTSDGDELVDADLCRRVFTLMQGVDFRLASAGGKCDARLECAFLFFFQNFRMCYIGEQRGMPGASAPTSSILAALLGTGTLLPTLAANGSGKAGGTAAAGGGGGLLDDMSDGASGGERKQAPARPRTVKQARYANMFARMGLGDHCTVIDLMVAKIANNLKFWAGNTEIIQKTLEVFQNLCSGYSSGRFLLTLDTAKYMVANHSPEEFPFLSVPAHSRERTTFYLSLTRLLVLTPDFARQLPLFLQPVLRVLHQLAATADFRQESVQQALIGVCRDLRGVTAATHNRVTYSALFDCLYPAHFPVLERAAAECYDLPGVTTALLKFMLEFVYNKAQRLAFGNNSANSILLFREASKLLVAYGSRIIALPLPAGDSREYKLKFKGMGLALNMITRILGGNYVNLAVFALYGDESLTAALDAALKIVFAMPLEQVLEYPSVASKYYVFLEVMFRNHMPALAALDTPSFLTLLKAVQQGLNNPDTTLSTMCATAIDHLASYAVEHGDAAAAAAASGTSADEAAASTLVALTAHMAACPSLLPTLLSDLFNMLLFEERSNYWSLSRPLLSIVLASSQALADYQAQLTASQPAENHERLAKCFATLTADTRRSLRPSSRDSFTQKVTAFRREVRSFLAL